MRALRHLVTGVLTTAISISVFGASPALAKADCSQRDPQADVSLTQSLSFDGVSYTDTATLINLGPCNVPDVSLHLTLPAGSTVGLVTSNPSAWACDTSVTCTPTSTMGVPGTAVISVSFTTAVTNPTVLGVITVGDATACAPNTPASTCDPYLDNNTSWAAFVPAGTGGSLTTCPVQFCDQYTDISVGAGGTAGGVQVQQLKQLCPPGFPNCFGKLVSITSPITGAVWTKTFTINAALVTVSYGKVFLINSTGGAWTAVSACGSTPTYPCVLSKTKFKSPDGQTFYQFVVLTNSDDSWGFD